MPPLPGVFFDNTFYYYNASASAKRRLVIGGNLVANVDASIAANFASVLWVPTTDFLGGTLGSARPWASAGPTSPPAW